MTTSIPIRPIVGVSDPYTPGQSDWLALISEAELLYRIGLPPLPVCRPLPGGCSASWHDHEAAPKTLGKRPLIVGYGAFAAQLPAQHEVQRWFERFPDSNLGVVIPAGVVGVDADSAAAADGRSDGRQALLRAAILGVLQPGVRMTRRSLREAVRQRQAGARNENVDLACNALQREGIVHNYGSPTLQQWGVVDRPPGAL